MRWIRSGIGPFWNCSYRAGCAGIAAILRRRFTNWLFRESGCISGKFVGDLSPTYYALLLTMYNLGARVSEISGLRQSHVAFGSKSYVQLHGKGRKDRSIPLWPRTARILKDLFRELGQPEQAMAFPSIRGEPVTRFAIHLLLRKAVDRASARCATRKKKRVSPHIVRHGTAMALLQSGVDIAVIALWLGHESIRDHECVFARESRHERKGVGKGLAGGHAISGASKRTILCLLSWSRYEPRLLGRI
jgi:integrase